MPAPRPFGQRTVIRSPTDREYRLARSLLTSAPEAGRSPPPVRIDSRSAGPIAAGSTAVNGACVCSRPMRTAGYAWRSAATARTPGTAASRSISGCDSAAARRPAGSTTSCAATSRRTVAVTLSLRLCPKIARPVITDRLIISADAVAAVRRGLRCASPAASRPMALNRVTGADSGRSTSRHSAGASSATARISTATAAIPTRPADLLVDRVGHGGVAVQHGAGCGHQQTEDGAPPDVGVQRGGLAAQRRGRGDPRGPPGRPGRRQDGGANADAQAGQDRQPAEGESRLGLLEAHCHCGEPAAERGAGHAADQPDHQCLAEHQPPQLPPGQADGAEQRQFPGPLADQHGEGVRDHEAAHQQRDAGEPEHGVAHGAADLDRGGEEQRPGDERGSEADGGERHGQPRAVRG
jgi:hypothetical protein